MRLTRIILLVLSTSLTAAAAFASDIGAVRGIVHDPQHRPVQNAMVMLHSKTSDWAASSTTDAAGEFNFSAVALGDYMVTVAATSFVQAAQTVRVTSGSQPVLHFSLSVSTNKETVNVSGSPEVAPTDSATPTTLVSRLDIANTPGAD